MDVRQRIGWNLRRLRKERDISQEDFATDSGFDRGYISGAWRDVRKSGRRYLVYRSRLTVRRYLRAAYRG